MTNYGQMKSTQRPPEIKVTDTMVFVAENIQSYTQVLEGTTIEGFTYTYKAYTKDEYILLLAEKSSTLEEQLQATKILLGVE